MDSSTLSIIVFLVTTAIYYFLKPIPGELKMLGQYLNPPEPNSNQDQEPYNDPGSQPVEMTDEEKESMIKDSNNTKFIYLIIYFLLNIICQTIINASSVINACGGSVSKNIGIAALYTIVPWVFIFGIMMAMLIARPSWKSAFSNVIGYYFVYYKTNEIFKELYQTPINETSIGQDNSYLEPSAPPKPEYIEGGQKGGQQDSNNPLLLKAIESINNIMTNPSIIINYMVPENFLNFWDKNITQLIKLKYNKDSNDKDTLMKKKELYEMVVLRDNIGESIWYIYTGLLLCVIVPYNIAKRGCKKDPQSLTDSIQSYKDEQAQAVQDDVAANSTVYVS